MKKISEMNHQERKVFDACYNGWFLSGEYRALLGGNESRFEVDSLSQLVREVTAWFNSHAENHGSDWLLVKCAQPL